MKRVQDALVLQQMCKYSPDFRNFDHRYKTAKHQVFGACFPSTSTKSLVFPLLFADPTQVGLLESDYVGYLSVHMR